MDNHWNLAAFDEETGMVHLHNQDEPPGFQVIVPRSGYTVNGVIGPDLDLKVHYAERLEGQMVEHERRVLLRFDQRGFGLHVRLDMPNAPRSGLRVTVGHLIDAVGTPDTPGTNVEQVKLNGSTTAIPALDFVDDQLEATTLIFWECPTAEECKTYYGRLRLADVLPKDLGCQDDVVVHVQQVDQINVRACRTAYDQADKERYHRFEHAYTKIVEPCTTVIGQQPLEFDLTFSR